MSASIRESRRVYLFDSTLRDGAQTQGVDFTAADKLALAGALDRLGVDYVEGGWPGANPTDDAFFAEPPHLETAKLVAFGMTRRPGRSVQNDPGLAALVQAKAPVACIVGKTWDFHVDVALEIPRAENLALIGDSLAYMASQKSEAHFDAEHFFDGFKANRDYALACLAAAQEAGARWLVLCDTNGGTLPHEVSEIVTAVQAALPEAALGIHCHDDTDNAVANSLAAVRAGARQVQGTLNGLGERCGNANLCALIPDLRPEDGLRGRRRRPAAGAVDLGLAPARRTPQPSGRSRGRLRRRSRLRPQGRAACLRRRQGPQDLRAYRAGPGRQRAAYRGVGSSRPFQYLGALF